MKKAFEISFCLSLILLFCSSAVFASSGTHNGTSNGLNYRMSYSVTDSRVTCGISCPYAHNTEAVAKVTFKMGDSPYLQYEVRNYSDPGTSAFTAWNAGTDQICIGAWAYGYVNDSLAYSIYMNP